MRPGPSPLTPRPPATRSPGEPRPFQRVAYANYGVPHSGGSRVGASAPSPAKAGGAANPAEHAEGLRSVVIAANADGLNLLRRGRGAQAFEQLKYAEAVLAANPQVAAEDGGLLALTCSNLGCYYRKVGLPRAALRYIGRAMKAEEAVLLSSALHQSQRGQPPGQQQTSPTPQSAQQMGSCQDGETSSVGNGSPPGGAAGQGNSALELAAAAGPGSGMDVPSLVKTKLNACAALSVVGSHERAERLAAEAAHLLAPRCALAPPPAPEGIGVSPEAAQAASQAAEEARKSECGLLAVACHNLGAEREHLGRWAGAAMAYAQGAEVAAIAFGPNSQMAKALSASADEALTKAEKHPELPDRPRPRRPGTLSPASGVGGRRRRGHPAGAASAGSRGTPRANQQQWGGGLPTLPSPKGGMERPGAYLVEEALNLTNTRSATTEEFSASGGDGAHDLGSTNGAGLGGPGSEAGEEEQWMSPVRVLSNLSNIDAAMASASQQGADSLHVPLSQPRGSGVSVGHHSPWGGAGADVPPSLQLPPGSLSQRGSGVGSTSVPLHESHVASRAGSMMSSW